MQSAGELLTTGRIISFDRGNVKYQNGKNPNKAAWEINHQDIGFKTAKGALI